MCRLPGHCAFWTASCHLSRSVSCAVAGQTECENISEDTTWPALTKILEIVIIASPSHGGISLAFQVL